MILGSPDQPPIVSMGVLGGAPSRASFHVKVKTPSLLSHNALKVANAFALS
jgi:hypothetical protein